MSLNQFAKISPVVNSNGFLLQKDQEGIYSIVSQVKLNNNETGICIEDNSIVVMFEGKPVKLTGGVFTTMSDILKYVSSNTSGDFDGQLLCLKDNPTQLYVIVGTQLYNLTEHTTKSVMVDIPSDAHDQNIFNTIENSVMQDIYSKKYLINSIDLRIPGQDYTFYNVTTSMNSGGMEVTNKTEIDYPVLQIEGSKSGSTDIEINPSCYNTITKCLIDREFSGKLLISLKASRLSSSNGTLIHKYDGDKISLIITYTPLID